METFEKVINWFNNSTGVKLGLIVILTLLLLIPSVMIMELISEREQRYNETINEVTSIWGDKQTITAPFITIPFDMADGEGGYTTDYLHVLPSDLNVEGEVIPEIRYRGIFKVVIYKTRLRFTGTFDTVTNASFPSGTSVIRSDESWIEAGISDMRGINSEVKVNWNGLDYDGIPGLMNNDIAESGIHAAINEIPAGGGKFSFELDINGSRSLNFVPLGRTTSVSLESEWDAPGFTGAFLPDNRNVSDSGFSAEWNVLHLNRNFPQEWSGNKYDPSASAFGVDLVTPVDNYLKSTRSAKYSILFIAVTFLVFLFAEIMNKVRIHAIHYLLAGLAATVFYSLLTALSEHIVFNFAYLISALVVITMITAYTYGIFKKKAVTLVMLLSLIILYSFLFIVLQLADYALLLGNVGIVVILATVMYFARKINWYS